MRLTANTTWPLMHIRHPLQLHCANAWHIWVHRQRDSEWCVICIIVYIHRTDIWLFDVYTWEPTRLVMDSHNGPCYPITISSCYGRLNRIVIFIGVDLLATRLLSPLFCPYFFFPSLSKHHRFNLTSLRNRKGTNNQSEIRFSKSV